MSEEKRFLVEVGMRDFPFPMRVASRENLEGQSTIGQISITARIMQEFEAHWINAFIRIVHRHRYFIGTRTLSANIGDYLAELKAKMVRVDFSYPFFIEKETPVSREKCLVRYDCIWTVRASTLGSKPRTIFKIEVPVITTDPASKKELPAGFLGQLTIASVEIESDKDPYPEDMVEIVDKHALAPTYSFLTEEDEAYLIKKIHTEDISSVVLTDQVKEELARDANVKWFSVHCANHGMLHSYSTIVKTEKSMWVPFSSYSEEEI